MTAIARIVFYFMRGGGIVPRAILLALLALALKLPLSLVSDIVTDRQSYESEAVKNVTGAWGQSQTLLGPMVRVPYSTTDGRHRTVTLLPDKLTINGKLAPQQRRRGLFDVTVYAAALDVVAEFPVKSIRDVPSDGRVIDWSSATLGVGLSDEKSIDAGTVEIDGQTVEWAAEIPTPLLSLKAPLGAVPLDRRDTITVRFRLTFGGSTSFAVAPVGWRTEVSLESPWPSVSFIGRYLPMAQSTDDTGFKARWVVPPLGRGYGQLWDGVDDSSATMLARSALGVALINPVDAYRETDRAIKYAVMLIGLTFAACLLFELAIDARPSFAQYGLIGLSLCVFYLLLLSFAERIGFAPAYLASASAVVAQATVYNWFLSRRWLLAAAFAATLTFLYAGLYTLLQLEEASLLSGSLVLFAVLSLAMWLTRNLHRERPA
ncbi:MAG TPA: cell envelope integrity protein CreD [Reyranella sp.]|nr:cell envelope integrity protein CreD [Reyranella sp.]